MKTVLLVSAFFISMQINAQTITSTSSAEDAIRFIENVAKTYVGKESKNPLSSVVFNGANFITSTDFGTSMATDEFSNINWAEFEKFSTIDQLDKNRIYVSFIFSSNLLWKAPLIYKSTNELLSTEIEEQNYFDFYIPLSEKNKLKELEAAANRLAAIAKANGSSLLAVKSRKIPGEGKPTYKETADYIKSYFDNDNKKQHDRIRTDWYSGGYLESLSYKILYVEIAGCTLYIGYESLNKNYFHNTEQRSVKTYEIDISRIEDIKVTLIGYKDAEIKDQYYVNNISFKVKNRSTEMLLPFEVIPANAENSGKETQIYKAFNHLRKLCGAPEPVKFE